jgi:plastocyanin
VSNDLEKSQQPLGEREWSRREFLLGAGGLAVVGVGALFAKSPIASAFQSLRPQQAEQGHIKLYQGDYYFDPNHMTWRVGDQVTIHLQNQSPNRPHEMWIGRGFDTVPTEYGPVATGFHTDFWDGVDVYISEAYHVSNWPTNKAKVKSIVSPHPWWSNDPADGNFSPALEPGGYVTWSFTVPNKPGRWMYGCFVQTFIHYEEGMRGTIDILPAQA